MARVINSRYLFIHSAKTGGTFFREALNYFGVPNFESGDFTKDDHISIYRLKQEQPELKHLYSFGFVRNPVTWYRSRWAYAMLTHFNEKISYMPAAREHWMAKCWSNNLNKFVEKAIEAYPKGIAIEYFDKMLGLIQGDGVHEVLRYEDLYEFLQKHLEANDRIVSIDQLKNLPIIRSSSLMRDQISPALIKEIEVHESVLMNMYY